MATQIPAVHSRIEIDHAADGLFSRVVIGVDFTPASLTAARWATEWVAQRAHAVLAHVGATTVSQADAVATTVLSGGAVQAESNSTISAGLDGFGSTLDTASISTVLRSGRPSYWLSIIAGWTEATLMVLGRRTDSARRRVGEPNVRERVARRSGAAVLVVPEGTVRPPDYILAAVDEGLFGRAVLSTAASLAALHRIPLVALHVLAPVTGAYERVIEGWRRARRTTPRAVSEGGDNSLALTPPSWLAEVSQSPVSLTVNRVQISVGDPAREIVSTGISLGAPLIVIGKRGADGAPEGSLGSVTRILLASCPLPVLAVGTG